MEAILSDLARLESKSVDQTVALDEVQASIVALERWRAALAAEDSVDDAQADGAMQEDQDEASLAQAALQQLQTSAKRVGEANKEWFGAMTKYGKAVEKKFSQDLSPLIPVPPNTTTATSAEDDSHMFFSSEESKATLDRILAMHFVRSGCEDVEKVFLQESGVVIPREVHAEFRVLHYITAAMRKGDLGPAFTWVAENRSLLHERRSPLEFHLHRSQYVRLLLSDTYPLPDSLASSLYANGASSSLDVGTATTSTQARGGAASALRYARSQLSRFHTEHAQEIKSLSAAALYLPIQRLLKSPYAHLFTSGTSSTTDAMNDEAPAVNPADEIYHAPHLAQLFASEYCSSLNMSHDLPLKVVTDVGGGGALAKIAKVKGVMKEKRTEWTTVQELPVEIPLPPQYRYHSVFACPVSKEQATDANPPMMMPCGHVVANQTLMRLCKGGQNVRCPYCPLSSAVSQAIRLYF